MLSALKNALKVKELRKKILFIFAMITVYRLGSFVPVPGVDPAQFRELIEAGGILGLLDLFTGGALGRFTIFAMGISPYITASIIMQLLTAVIPKLEQLQKEGPEGRKIIAQYTRYATVALGFIQGIGFTMFIQNMGAIPDPNIVSLGIIVLTLTAGTAFLMWLGEQITEKGIGNGISILIFTSIISVYPSVLFDTIERFQLGTVTIWNLLIFVVAGLALVAAIIFVQQGERRIPVQYSKRVVGRRIYGGRSTHIPMKVNQAGVIPVIFASSVLAFPVTIAQLLPWGWAQSLADALQPEGALYMAVFAAMIIFFTYFYTAITFNPQEVSDNIKKYGGFIPGLRPGRSTASYMDRILTRITLAGAVFLAIVAILPNFMFPLTQVNIEFGGTSLLIVTGVALETMKQIESHLLMRHYEGFMR